MNAIEFRNIGVSYQSHRIPTFKEWLIRRGGRGGTRNVYWALKNVTFDVPAGETLGIIGGNGAGKSTLLRVAAGIIPPTTGECVVRGAVAPLIELGTGFDSELSGRENIFFNGALLGRTRAEMDRRVDEIIEFADLHGFIDEPLRAYSTGMVARLAFSIATTSDAEVVLLDEILSVGDMSFRERCEERIRSFARRGATIVLVSHELPVVEEMCRRAIWVDGGTIRAYGEAHDVVRRYYQAVHGHHPVAAVNG